MAMTQTTVLITTANNPPPGAPFLRMTNTVMRAITAKAALYFWIAQGAKNIVLADATESNLLTDLEMKEIESLQTRVEQISYQQDFGTVRKKGKGYGEGKLIEYALGHSELLAGVESFFKCTGKTYVRNFPTIADFIRINKLSSIFWRDMKDGTSMLPWTDCRFYYTSRTFARQHLIPAYLASDDAVSACEHYIYRAVSHSMQVGKALRPLISGFSGGTGESYFDASLGYLDDNFPCWVELPQAAD
jgi:hypothetical protein